MPSVTLIGIYNQPFAKKIKPLIANTLTDKSENRCTAYHFPWAKSTSLLLQNTQLNTTHPHTQHSEGEGCFSSLTTEFSRMCIPNRINAQNRFFKEDSLPLDKFQAILQWTALSSNKVRWLCTKWQRQYSQ